jgi:hypothetical protein
VSGSSLSQLADSIGDASLPGFGRPGLLDRDHDSLLLVAGQPDEEPPGVRVTVERLRGGYLAAAYHLKLAVEALRRIGGMGDRADELHARLLDYERRGMAEMETRSP